MDLKEKILVECYLSQTGLSHNQMVKDRLNLEIKNNEHDYALSAMDELSKQVAIAFGLWILSESVLPRDTCWFDAGKHLTTEELFQLFTLSKEYQELIDGK